MHNYVILFYNVSDQIEWFYFSFVFKLIRWLYMYMYIQYYIVHFLRRIEWWHFLFLCFKVIFKFDLMPETSTILASQIDVMYLKTKRELKCLQLYKQCTFTLSFYAAAPYALRLLEYSLNNFEINLFFKLRISQNNINILLHV